MVTHCTIQPIVNRSRNRSRSVGTDLNVITSHRILPFHDINSADTSTSRVPIFLLRESHFKMCSSFN